MLQPDGDQGEDVKNESRRKPQPGVATSAAGPESTEGGERYHREPRRHQVPGLVLWPGIALEPLFQVLDPLLELVQAAFIGQAAAGK